jgi:biotin synthase-like enzyme
MDPAEIFEDSSALLEAMREADALTRKHHGDYATLERAIFLSWWCGKGDCAFCYMSTQKKRADPKKARRHPASILCEAELMRRIGWNVEFLSGGFGSYDAKGINEIAEMVALTTGRPVWLNVGEMSPGDLDLLGEAVEGITGAVETVSPQVRERACPSKPLEPIKAMLEDAKERGFGTGITIILGLGETPEDLPALLELVGELELDRVTYYSLNPHEDTAYADTPSPASLYQAGVIAATRLRFPDIKIIGGTWIDQLTNIGPMLLAGANGITKYPFLEMYGTRHGAKVEDEARAANRVLLGTFTDLEVIRGKSRLPEERDPLHVLGYTMPHISKEARKRTAALEGKKQDRIKSYLNEIMR